MSNVLTKNVTGMYENRSGHFRNISQGFADRTKPNACKVDFYRYLSKIVENRVDKQTLKSESFSSQGTIP